MTVTYNNIIKIIISILIERARHGPVKFNTFVCFKLMHTHIYTCSTMTECEETTLVEHLVSGSKNVPGIEY